MTHLRSNLTINKSTEVLGVNLGLILKRDAAMLARSWES